MTPKTNAKTPATPADSGQAGEYLVASDLLKRGLRGTKPLNTNGPHDLHFKFADGWRTLQVKLGQVNTQTGTIYLPRRRSSITSDIIAVVDLTGSRVRYIANIGPLPAELADG